EAAFAPYVDRGVAARVLDAHRDAQITADETLLEMLTNPESVQSDDDDEPASITERRDAIQSDAEAVLERYQERLANLAKELETDLAPIRERMDDLEADLADAVDELDIELPDRPEPDIDEPDESDWLLDITRPFFEQLAVYKARKSIETDAAQD